MTRPTARRSILALYCALVLAPSVLPADSLPHHRPGRPVPSRPIWKINTQLFALSSVGVAGADPGADILIDRRVPLQGAPMAALVSAYKTNHGIPEGTDRSTRSTSMPKAVRPR